MKQAIIYARYSPRRTSRDGQELKTESIEAQVEHCLKYCQERHYEVVGEPFADKALSGGEEDRPALWEAIAALKRGCVLVVYRLDRLARDVYLSEYIRREVVKQRATVEAVQGGGNGDSPEETMMRQVLQAYAEYERKIIAIRTSVAMKRHQAAGRRMSDRCPYGWRRDPDDPLGPDLVEDPAEQEIVKRIVAERQNGAGLRKICRALEADGMKCRGGKFYHTTIKNILRRAGLE